MDVADYQATIQRYGKQNNVVMYIDPPYMLQQSHYGLQTFVWHMTLLAAD